MSHQLSLREIGRRLNIPPSSVAYYKDRFQQYIPSTVGGGRRVKYPLQAVQTFKEIREMFNNNCSAEEIEEYLEHKYINDKKSEDVRMNVQLNNKEFTAQAHAGCVADDISGVLRKMTDVIENQALFRAQIDSLRSEVASLQHDREQLEERYKLRIASLESEIEDLRQERTEMLKFFMDHVDASQGAGKNGGEGEPAPGELFLTRPLVIRNEKQEYLGVSSKNRAFTLQEFIRIMKRNNRHGKSVSTRWKQSEAGWVLHIATSQDQGGENEAHEHILELQSTVTPNGNNVVQLTRMTIDGNQAPEPFLLMLFRKIKEDFEA